jgi:ubiquinone/menaquinone biosynthesis C-methylase UbiE/uncharacterized protein YbaR (Trm112 family)
MNFDISILRCPLTGEDLYFADERKFEEVLIVIPEIYKGLIHSGLTNQSKTYFYPIIDDIPLLTQDYALYIGKGRDELLSKRLGESQRVYNYYNSIDFECVDNIERYNDTSKWLDFRDVSHAYISQSLLRAKRYLGGKGKYLLDIASGPVGLKEYIELSYNFETRICIDISINALRMARRNLGSKKSIYICGDIKSIPLKTNLCDAVLCQHTLFHIHKEEQKTALDELCRTARESAKIVIVYSLFYRSLFMNIAIFPVQVYRISRHLAGKLYAGIFKPKSHLYFYSHSLTWFKKWASDGKSIEIYSWRSVNKYFLNLYVHKKLFGGAILKLLSSSEEKHPQFWGKIGEYPLIVVTKLAGSS